MMDYFVDINSSVKDVNCWTTYVGDLFIVVNVCVESVSLSRDELITRMVYQCATDYQEQYFSSFEFSCPTKAREPNCPPI